MQYLETLHLKGTVAWGDFFDHSIPSPNPWSRPRNFRQKNNSAEDGIDGTYGFFDRIFFWLFRGTENSRNFVPNTSTEEKTTRNSVPWNKNRSKLSEFPSEPFSGRETTRNSLPNLQRKRKQLGIPFRGKKYKKKIGIPFQENNSEQNAAAAVYDSIQIESSFRGRKNWFPPPWLKVIFQYLDCSVKLHFFAEFRSVRSVLSFGIGSSAELSMPRNEHFLPRNNGNRSQPYAEDDLGSRVFWGFGRIVSEIDSRLCQYKENTANYSWRILHLRLFFSHAHSPCAIKYFWRTQRLLLVKQTTLNSSYSPYALK